MKKTVTHASSFLKVTTAKLAWRISPDKSSGVTVNGNSSSEYEMSWKSSTIGSSDPAAFFLFPEQVVRNFKHKNLKNETLNVTSQILR